MDRLTKRGEIGEVTLLNGAGICFDNEIGRRAKYEKLAIYEERQEQGLLVELPCKLGDKVWLKVNDYLTTTAKVVAIRFEQDGVLIKLQYFIEHCNDESKMEIRYWYVDFNDFGKKVFLTEDEAMPKPVEVQNG